MNHDLYWERHRDAVQAFEVKHYIGHAGDCLSDSSCCDQHRVVAVVLHCDFCSFG